MRLDSNGRTDIALPWRHAVAVLVQASGSPFTPILIHIMNTYIYSFKSKLVSRSGTCDVHG